MRFLITGGTGFIGSYVTRALVHAGHAVTCFDSLPDGNAIERILTPMERQGVSVVAGDVADALALVRAIRESGAEAVIHLASLLIPASDADPTRALQVNSASLLHVLEASRLFGLRRVVWASSVAVFGDRSLYADTPIPDEALHAPRTVYGATKSLNESMAAHYHRRWGVASVGLRYTIVYGHARVRGASSFATELLTNPALGRPGTVEHADLPLDWQYVEDAVAVTVAAALHDGPTPKLAYNTGGVIGTAREVAEIVTSLLPGAQFKYVKGEQSGGGIPALDTSAVQRDLGVAPGFPLRSGILRTINAVRREAGMPEIGKGIQ